MAIKTYVGGGGVAGAAGKWGEAKAWSPEGVPTNTTDAKFVSTSGSCEIAAAAKCKSIDCTGYTGTLTHKVGAPLSVGGATEGEGGIALRFVAGMTYAGGTEAEIAFVGSSGKVEKLFCGGKTLGIVIVEKASIKLEDANACAKMKLSEGTLDTNSQTCEWDFISTTAGFTRVLKLGASLVKLVGKGVVWEVSGAGLTIEPGTSVIEILDGGNTAKTFMGGGFAYHDLVLAGESNTTGNVKTITSSNSFHKLALNCPNVEANSGVHLESGSTQTVEELTTTAKSGKPLKLQQASGTPGKLSKASGNVSVDWLEITNVETNNAVSWYAGVNTTLSGSTTFWKKAAPGETIVYTDTATGTATATGTVTERLTHTASPTGTGSPSGSSTGLHAYIETRTGTAAASGNSTGSHVLTDSRTGTAASQGTVTGTHVYRDTQAGTGTATGSASDEWHQGIAPKPCLMTFASTRPAVTMTITVRPAVTFALSARPTLAVTPGAPK